MRGHIRKRGSSWAVIVDLGQDPDTGKRKQKWHSGFPTRKAAQEALVEILGRLKTGNYVTPKKLTFGEYLESWLSGLKSQVRPSTWESYERNVRIHVKPRLGHIYVQQLTPTALTSCYAELLDGGRREGRNVTEGRGEGLSPRTVHYIHTIIHRALRDAMNDGIVVQNVADRARPPKQRAVKSNEMRTWAASELRAFLEHVTEDRLYPVFMVAATTGMRRGEVLGLRWRDIDLDAARASIRQTIVCVRHEICFSEPKTKKGKRSVPLAPETVAVLRAHRKRQAEERLAIGAAYEDRDLVFAGPNGSPLDPESVSLVFDRRVARSGLPRVRFHDLRHTFATLALQASVHPKVVSEILGHSNISITLDTYSHAIPAMQEAATTQVAQLVFGGAGA
ncbi:MAG: tyrosine-type recombinase/integrase [Actinomycetota bacterium]